LGGGDGDIPTDLQAERDCCGNSLDQSGTGQLLGRGSLLGREGGGGRVIYRQTSRQSVIAVARVLIRVGLAKYSGGAQQQACRSTLAAATWASAPTLPCRWQVCSFVRHGAARICFLVDADPPLRIGNISQEGLRRDSCRLHLSIQYTLALATKPIRGLPPDEYQSQLPPP